MTPIKGMADLNKLRALGKAEVKDIETIMSNSFKHSLLTISGVNELSGYKFEMVTLTPADINRWRTSMYSGSMITERFMLYRTIYDKLISTSLDITNKVSVVDFEKNTLIIDVENMLHTLYLATYPENNEIPLICNNPKMRKKINIEEPETTEMSKAELIGELLLNRSSANTEVNETDESEVNTEENPMSEEEELYAEPDNSKFGKDKICRHRNIINLKAYDIEINRKISVTEEYFNDISKTGVLKNHRLVFYVNDNKTVVTLALPTIAKQKAIYGNIDDEKLFEDYGEILLTLLYVEKIGFITKDEADNDVISETTDDEKIFDIISNKLHPDDFNTIIGNVQALASAYQISFKLPEFKCKECGGKIGGMEIPSMEELFQRRFVQNRQ